MFCSACTSSFTADARFCTGCGQPLSQPTPRVQAPLMRSRYGKMIAGVCAGFAHSYGWDVTLVRLAVCLGVLFSAGTVLLGYIIAWIVMPTGIFVLPAQTANAGVTTA